MFVHLQSILMVAQERGWGASQNRLQVRILPEYEGGNPLFLV